MTPQIKAIVIGIVGGILSAAKTDLSAYQKAREDGKPFDWTLAFTRWVNGAITGLLAALGIQVAIGA